MKTFFSNHTQGHQLPKSLSIISLPHGKVWEYAELALNIYKGCTHGCRYCYCAGMKFTNPQKYFSGPDPKHRVIEKLKSDLVQLGPHAPEICISFLGDPYQPAEMQFELTRQVLQVLVGHGQPFTILTKGGMRAARDFDLLRQCSVHGFGTTLVFWDQRFADYWEPNAAPLQDRANAIVHAKQMGIRTWVSIEPVIDPNQAFAIIQNLHPYVDHWKIGKLNHHPEIERRVDWVAFREEVRVLLSSIGADYYLKRSLTNL